MNNSFDKKMMRRQALGWLSASALAAIGSAVPLSGVTQTKPVLRIGYQKYGTLTLLRGTGALEKRLAVQSVDVRWTEFPAGPQLLEGLNVGSIDFGTVGEAPPIFAQAAGADFVYVANEPPAPKSEAIIVPHGSVVRRVADLKGKKIALNKGSNVHYLLVRALEKNGLAYKDVETIFLPPSDARAAFERGSVDAWVIWDPFLAAAEKQLNARIVADGTGLVSNHQFYLSTRAYQDKRPDIIRIVIEELAKIDEWGNRSKQEVAKLLSTQVGLPPEIVELAAQRYSYGVKFVDARVLEEQQKIADAFVQLKLIPKRIAVRDAAIALAAV